MSTSNSMEITRELFQILKQFSRLKWEQKPYQELKPSECELLGILYLNLGDGTRAVTPSELSDQLKITPAGVTHLINPLEESDYIERLQNPNDRRFVLIGLTKKGKQLAESLIAQAHDRLAGLVDYLGDEDSKALIRVMSSTIEFFVTNSL
jgi:DNA-binding MarR family transcriptional regulator